jgi:hypothetical protein
MTPCVPFKATSRPMTRVGSNSRCANGNPFPLICSVSRGSDPIGTGERTDRKSSVLPTLSRASRKNWLSVRNECISDRSLAQMNNVELAARPVKNPFDWSMRFETLGRSGREKPRRVQSQSRSLPKAHADVRISGSAPTRRPNWRMRDKSRSPLSGARSAGKVRITRPLAQTIGARGSTPGIAAEML